MSDDFRDTHRRVSWDDAFAERYEEWSADMRDLALEEPAALIYCPYRRRIRSYRTYLALALPLRMFIRSPLARWRHDAVGAMNFP